MDHSCGAKSELEASSWPRMRAGPGPMICGDEGPEEGSSRRAPRFAGADVVGNR